VNRAGGERGVTAVTYALMVAIIAVVLVGGVFVLGDSIKAALNGGAACVSDPQSCEGGAAGGGGSGGGGGGGGSATTTTVAPTTTAPAGSTTSTTAGP
jgi:Flp pilus assembly pilin Flp